MSKTAAEDPALALTPAEAKAMAEAVRKIEKAVRDLAHGGLNRRALVVLLHDVTGGVAKRDINAVLDGLEALGATYLEISETKKDAR